MVPSAIQLLLLFCLFRHLRNLISFEIVKDFLARKVKSGLKIKVRYRPSGSKDSSGFFEKIIH